MDIIEWERAAPSVVPTGFGFRAGASRIDITPPLGSFTAGWGPNLAPRRGHRCMSRLFARVLVLDDGLGERVALMAADLHAGSRYLAERVAALTADMGFHVGRIVLAGTHCHSGPGNMYATPYYDAFSTSFPWVRGFHRELAEDMAWRMAQAVRDACAALEPARVGFGSSAVWNWTANRSVAALRANFSGQSEAQMCALLAAWGKAPPEVTSLERLAVDARVQVLTAATLAGEPIGCFATFAGHASLYAREHSVLSADWFGVAQNTAETLLQTEFGARPVVALGAGSIGDVDPRPPGLTLPELILQRQKSIGENALLVQRQGARLGAALVDACERGLKSLQQPRLSVRFVEAPIRGETVPTEQGLMRMPEEARIGASTLAGSELGPGFLSEGLRDGGPPNWSDAHWPKVDDDLGMRIIKPVLDVLKYQAPQMPLRLVQVGSTALLGLPGEPTTWLAKGLTETIKRALPGVADAFVAGTCGDYVGYFTTEKEYELQHYEGASTLWGRYTERWLHQAFERLAVASPSVPQGSARFVADPFIGTKRVPLSQCPKQQGPPVEPPRLERLGAVLRVSGAFQASAQSVMVPLCEWGPWLRLRTPDGTALGDEPQLLWDEWTCRIWWSVQINDWTPYSGQTLHVVVQHHDGSGSYSLNIPP